MNQPPRGEERTVDWSDVVRLLREGLPAEAIDRLSSRLGIPQEAMLRVLGISRRTYQRRLRDGHPLSATAADRAYRLAKIVVRAEAVFGTPDLAHDWLRTPNRALGDTPVGILDTEAGAEQVDQVLGRLEHGVYS